MDNKDDLEKIKKFDPGAGPAVSMRTMLPTLVMDGALPLLAFIVLTRLGVPLIYALVAGGLFPAMNIAWQWAKTRRLEMIGIIVMSFMVLGAATSLVTGSPFFTLAKESFLTAAFGLLCLGSLLGERPLMFYITRETVPDESWWNSLWELPRFRSMMRRITAVWGIAYIAEASLRIVFVIVLAPALVVAISPVMIFAVVIVLTIWTRRTLLAARERRIRELEAGLGA